MLRSTFGSRLALRRPSPLAPRPSSNAPCRSAVAKFATGEKSVKWSNEARSCLEASGLSPKIAKAISDNYPPWGELNELAENIVEVKEMVTDIKVDIAKLARKEELAKHEASTKEELAKHQASTKEELAKHQASTKEELAALTVVVAKLSEQVGTLVNKAELAAPPADDKKAGKPDWAVNMAVSTAANMVGLAIVMRVFNLIE